MSDDPPWWSITHPRPGPSRSGPVVHVTPGCDFKILSMSYVSDHGILKFNEHDWFDDGTLVHPPHWRSAVDPEYVAPITHPVNKPLEMELQVQVDPDWVLRDPMQVWGECSFLTSAGNRKAIRFKTVSKTKRSGDWLIRVQSTVSGPDRRSPFLRSRALNGGFPP